MTSMDETPFVIHRHVKNDEVHFDLMIRRGEKLATWSFPEMPGAAKITGKRNSDHRLKYLTYEGPISSNRGTTTIVERASCEILAFEDRHVEVVFKGAQLAGRYLLHETPDGQWLMRHEQMGSELEQ